MQPVKPELELGPCWETVTYAENQPEYLSLPVIRSVDDERRVISRWQLTDDERQRIAFGADILLTLLTFGEQLQPIILQVGPERLDHAGAPIGSAPCAPPRHPDHHPIG